MRVSLFASQHVARLDLQEALSIFPSIFDIVFQYILKEYYLRVLTGVLHPRSQEVLRVSLEYTMKIVSKAGWEMDNASCRFNLATCKPAINHSHTTINNCKENQFIHSIVRNDYNYKSKTMVVRNDYYSYNQGLDC